MNMWMMGYNDGGDLNFGNDSFNNGRKLRPLIPRPLSSSLSTTSSSSSSAVSINPPLNIIHTNDFFSQFHHMAMATDQSKRELNNVPPPVVVSSRWNPTPEQLRVLEELYRRGTRTPSADQIQHITAQLRRYGKIEGKNVFYWFQNHKARERQKRRRQMESAAAIVTTDDYSARDIEILDRKDSGSARTVYELEQTKNWVPSTNCSTLVESDHTCIIFDGAKLPSEEESGPIQRAAKASLMAATDCRTDNGWIQFQELHQQTKNNNNNFAQKNSNCSNSNNNNNDAASSLQLIHCSAAVLGGGQIMMNTTPTITTTATITTIMHQNGIEELEELEEGEGELGCGEESETLQLFPLCSDHHTRNCEIIGGKNGCETVENSGMNSSNLTPLQFFEFLPLKN